MMKRQAKIASFEIIRRLFMLRWLGIGPGLHKADDDLTILEIQARS
jgi:hypothetical protein